MDKNHWSWGSQLSPLGNDSEILTKCYVANSRRMLTSGEMFDAQSGLRVNHDLSSNAIKQQH